MDSELNFDKTKILLARRARRPWPILKHLNFTTFLRSWLRCSDVELPGGMARELGNYDVCDNGKTWIIWIAKCFGKELVLIMSCYWQKPMNICSVHLTQNITQSILCYMILQISPISSENLNMQYFFYPNHRNANRTTSTTKSDSSEYRFQLQNFQLQLNPNSCDRLSPWARWLVIDSHKRIWVASCNKLRKYMTQSSIRLLLSGNVQDN